MIAIVDYGVGNLFSLNCSFKACGLDALATADTDVIKGASGIILPGVGAFRDASEKLRQSGLDKVVKEEALAGKPVMGICLGMQLLFEKSLEYGEYEGLGLLKGIVKPISHVAKNLKIPHMGWNSLDFCGKIHPLFKYIKEGDFVYFVHSYFADANMANVIATAEYGMPITAAVAKGNIMGCQFHPEKSGDVGLNILKAFCELCEKENI